jgi:hypothetical protein
MANQVDFKILPSDQFNVYSPQTRSEKIITYFTLLSKLRGDILAVSSQDDPNDIVSAYYSNVGGTQTLHLVKADGSEVTASNTYAGTVTSVDMSVPTGFAISGNPITSAGTLAVSFASGYSLPTDAIQATWTTAYNRSITSAAVTGTSTKTLTLNQQDGGTITASWTDIDTGLTSVGLTMPSAFSVANSPLTANGTIAVTGAGTAAQYVRGDGQLANFPASGGGGSTINYYLNGSVNQGTFGGTTYYELSKDPIAGAGTNFTRTSAEGPGYIASFITDAGDPALLNIPGGNWNLEIYFNSSSNGRNPSFYGEVYKVDSSNVFTLIASNSGSPEGITNGTTLDQYFTSIAVPQTTLLVTDRLAVRIYVNPDTRNITMHTEGNNFCEVITTFSTGLNALNGLTAQVQYFATGTSGTDFSIDSVTNTHTFNLPTASSTNRGALSSTDWTTFNSKASDAFKTIAVSGQSNVVADSAADTLTFEAGSNIVITTDAATDKITISAVGGGSGSVTSVDMSVPTGFAISGNPITSSGTLALAFASGYSLPTDASQSNWNTAYNDSITAFAYNTSTGVLTLTQQDAGTLTATVTLQPFSTTNLSEGTNLYFTTSRARQSLSAGTGISYDNSTGVITNSAPDQIVSLSAGTGISTSGTYPSFTITNTAPDKTVVLTGAGTTVVTGTYPSFTITSNDQYVGTVTSVATSAPITGGTITTSGTIGITQSGTSSDGYLSSTDWNTFNSKIGGSGTTNYVAKFTGSGTVGSSQIFDNGTNVGIGTASPSEKLHVAGIGRFDSYVQIYGNWSTTYPIVQLLSTKSGGQTWNIENGRNSNNLEFYAVGSVGTVFSIAHTTGNVGIFTTSPGYKLDVFGGSITSRRAISAPRISSAGEYTYGVTNSPTWNTNNGSYTNNNATSADGNTTAGTYTLSTSVWDLYQTISATSGVEYTIGVWVKLGTATNFCIVVNNTQNWNTVGGKAFDSSDGLSTSKWTHISYTFTGPATGQINLHIGAHSESGIPQQTAGTVFLWNWEMSVYSSTWIGKVDDEIRLPGNSIWTSRGNVGIGTTAPIDNLHIVGGVTSTSIASPSNTSVGSLQFGYDGTNGLIRSWNSSPIIYQAYNYQAWETSGSERMRITSGGNVGIGTTSPAQKLDVRGFVVSDSQSNGSESAFYLGNSAHGLSRANLTNDVVLYTTSGDVKISGNTAAVTHLIVKNGGNVGIGTTSPSQKLDVFGTIKAGIAGNSSANIPALLVTSSGTGDEQAAIAIQQATSEGDTIIFADYEPYVEWGISTENAGNKIQFTAGTSTGSLGSKTLYNNAGTARTAYIKFDHDLTSGQTLIGGNVGIGTTSPQSKLDVVGVIRYGNNAASIGALSYGSVGVVTLEAASTNTSIGIIPSGTGKVGINTIAPDTMLHVVGDIKVTGGYYDSSADIGSAGQFLKSTGTGTNWTTVNVIDGSGTANYVAKWSDSDTITDSIIFDNGTDVGIGTATPGSKLDILSSANPFITVRTASYAAVLGADTTNGYIRIGAGTNHAVGTVVNGTIRTWIDTDGDFGIGTTTPGSRLSVSGSNSSTVPLVDLVTTGTGSFQRGVRLLNSGMASTNSIMMAVGRSDNSKNMGQFYFYYDADGSNDNRISMGLHSVDDVLNITALARVGIGTTSPNNKLDIRDGNIELSDSAFSNIPEIRFTGNSGGRYVYAGIKADEDGNFNGHLEFWTTPISANHTAANAAFSERMRITAAGNVGIGTASPSGLLHVNKQTGVTSFTSSTFLQMVLSEPNGEGAEYVGIDFTGYSPSYTGKPLGRIAVIPTGSGTVMSFGTSNSYTTGVTNQAMVIYYNGNVGIGTTSPSAPLHVYKSDTYSAIISRADWNTSIPTKLALAKQYGILAFISTDLVETTNDTSYIALNYKSGLSSYSEGLRVYNNGNIGIGETAPATLVHLNKSNADSLVTSTPSIIISNRNSTSGSFIGGGIFNNTYRDVSTSSITAGIYFLNKNSVDAGALAKVSDIIFATGNYSTDWVAPDEKMRLTTDGLLGLGVSAPSYKLHISAGTDLIRITSSNTDARINIGHSGNGGYIGYANIGTGARNNVFYVTTGAGTIGSGFIVDNDGNVGIGTTSPTYKLDVNGSGRFSGLLQVNGPASVARADSHGISLFNGNDDYRISFDSQSGTRGFIRYNVDTAGSTFHGHIFSAGDYNGAVTELMLVRADGNVGINNTSPSAKLHVSDVGADIVGGNAISTSTMKGVMIQNTNNGDESVGVWFNTGGNHWSGISGQRTSSATNWATDLRFYTHEAATVDLTYARERMRIDSAGNVGIGTTAPDYKLEVSGNAAFGTIGNVIFTKSNGSSYSRFLYSGANSNVIFTGGAGGLGINNYADSTRLVQITDAGNVGIGTTAPTGKLTVKSPGEVGTYGDGFVLQRNANTAKLIRMYESSADGYLEVRTGADDIVSKLSGYSGTPSYFLSNVGIGTSTPMLTTANRISLTVNGTSDSVAVLGIDGNWKSYWYVNATASYLASQGNRTLTFEVNSGERMVINGSGNVGIGTTSPGTAYRLVAVTGVGQTGAIQTTGSVNIGTGALGVNVTPSATAGRIDASNDIVAYSTSDKRLKENIKPIENALEKVKSLTGVEFDWIEGTKDVHGYEGHDVGVIAQEVQAVLPEAIRTNESGYLSVRYEKIIGLLVEAMKEQQKEIDELKKLIK